jgi:hypothetical protein
MTGDGVIELRRLRVVVEAAGCGGPIEVEIINQALRDAPGDEVLALLAEGFRPWTDANARMRSRRSSAPPPGVRRRASP